MKNAILGLVIVVCLLGVVAIQFDWLNFDTKKDDKGKTHVDMSLDKDKATQDVKAGVEKGKELGKEALEKGKELGGKAVEAGKEGVKKIEEKLGGGDKATPPSPTKGGDK